MNQIKDKRGTSKLQFSWSSSRFNVDAVKQPSIFEMVFLGDIPYKAESWNEPFLSLYVRAFSDIDLGLWQEGKG